jgi:hypothetical protein
MQVIRFQVSKYALWQLGTEKPQGTEKVAIKVVKITRA